ncbi:MAG: hypothetical protein AAGM22_07555 [Acidobacteriota bacterium]
MKFQLALVAVLVLSSSVCVRADQPQVTAHNPRYMDSDGWTVGHQKKGAGYINSFSLLSFIVGHDPNLAPSSELATILRKRPFPEDGKIEGQGAFSCKLETGVISYRGREQDFRLELSSTRHLDRIVATHRIAACWSASLEKPVQRDVLVVLVELERKRDSRIVFFAAEPSKPGFWHMGRIWPFGDGLRFNSLFDQSRWGLFQEQGQISLLLPFENKALAYELHFGEDVSYEDRLTVHVFPISETLRDLDPADRSYGAPTP